MQIVCHHTAHEIYKITIQFEHNLSCAVHFLDTRRSDGMEIFLEQIRYSSTFTALFVYHTILSAFSAILIGEKRTKLTFIVLRFTRPTNRAI